MLLKIDEQAGLNKCAFRPSQSQDYVFEQDRNNGIAEEPASRSGVDDIRFDGI